MNLFQVQVNHKVPSGSWGFLNSVTNSAYNCPYYAFFYIQDSDTRIDNLGGGTLT